MHHQRCNCVPSTKERTDMGSLNSFRLQSLDNFFSFGFGLVWFGCCGSIFYVFLIERIEMSWELLQETVQSLASNRTMTIWDVLPLNIIQLTITLLRLIKMFRDIFGIEMQRKLFSHFFFIKIEFECTSDDNRMLRITIVSHRPGGQLLSVHVLHWIHRSFEF